MMFMVVASNQEWSVDSKEVRLQDRVVHSPSGHFYSISIVSVDCVDVSIR